MKLTVSDTHKGIETDSDFAKTAKSTATQIGECNSSPYLKERNKIMITNKDIRVENGNLVINGDKYPLDGQSPEAIMQIVKDNSDTTPTADSTAPITSGGTKTYVDNLIITQYLDTNIATIAADSITTIDIPFDAPAGYKAIGISEVLTSSQAVAVMSFNTERNSSLKVKCHNLYSAAVSNVTLGVTLIFVRN